MDVLDISHGEKEYCNLHHEVQVQCRPMEVSRHLANPRQLLENLSKENRIEQ